MARRGDPRPSVRDVLGWLQAFSRCRAVVFSATLATLFSACAGETPGEDAGVVRVDSAGVEIVTSPATDRALDWTFERQFSLGGALDGPESFTSVHPTTVGADGAGRIYMLDLQQHRVVVFGPDGEFVRTMGREGDGPGELAIPAGLAVQPSGAAFVFDYGHGGLVGFDTTGASLPPQPFRFLSAPGTNRHMALNGDRTVVASAARGDVRKVQLLTWSLEAESDTTVLASLPATDAKMVQYTCIGLSLRPIFEPAIIWAMGPQGAVAARTAQYAIDLFTPEGVRRASIRRSIQPRTASAEVALAELGDGLRVRFGSGECHVEPDALVEGRGFADVVPVIADLLVSPAGELWVERKVVGRDEDGDPLPGPIDVFDATGAYMGTLPVGTPFPLLILPDGRIAFKETDDLDIERLIVARVNRGPSERLESADR